MSEYHESWDALSGDVKDMHRAMKSLQEEIEAVDWYHQRQSLCEDEDLKKVLVHNRDEEIEHAAMTIEWLRRRVPQWDRELRTYLFATGPITEIEERAVEDPAPDTNAKDDGAAGLGIGNLS